MTNQKKYRTFCKTRNDIPIFSQPFWLDAVCAAGRWHVCLVEEKENIVGCLPYFVTKEKGFKVIRMPLLTPYLGVQIFYPDTLAQKKKIAFEQKITAQLIEQLPKTSYIQIIHHPDFKNWLPFHWANFQQTTMYTYRLNIKNIDSVFSNFRKNLKRNINAVSQHLKCIETDDLDLFYRINQTTFSRQSLKMPYTFDFFRHLDERLKKNNRRIIFTTFDKNNTPLASGYFIWDNQTAYYLAGGHIGHREAMSCTMWHAIQYFSKKVQFFDFEGSMNKNIAHFFSGFGGDLTPYHHVYKGKNKFIDLLKMLKS
ncbi:MAG TPA: GNAT family N-acetyltransferase [Saprospiraceae bacterium]|nr:GNAT family N-acetyltransferase [Saprospiraceae bacterium]